MRISTAISKMVTRFVCQNDQEERQSDAAVHWDTMRPELLRAFADRWAQGFSEKDWLRHTHQGSNKTRFEYREDYQNSLTCFRTIQGHTGGITLAPELMVHVIILTIGKCLCFTGVVPSTSNPFLKTDSLLEEKKARSDDRPSSSHFSAPPVMTSQFPGKCTITAVGNMIKMPSIG